MEWLVALGKKVLVYLATNKEARNTIIGIVIALLLILAFPLILISGG